MAQPGLGHPTPQPHEAVGLSPPVVGTVISHDGDRESPAKGTGVTGGCRAVAPPAWDRDGDALHSPQPSATRSPVSHLGDTGVSPEVAATGQCHPARSRRSPRPTAKVRTPARGAGGRRVTVTPPGTHRAAGKPPLLISLGGAAGPRPLRPAPWAGGRQVPRDPHTPEGGEEGAPRRVPPPPGGGSILLIVLLPSAEPGARSYLRRGLSAGREAGRGAGLGGAGPPGAGTGAGAGRPGRSATSAGAGGGGGGGGAGPPLPGPGGGGGAGALPAVIYGRPAPSGPAPAAGGAGRGRGRPLPAPAGGTGGHRAPPRGETRHPPAQGAAPPARRVTSQSGAGVTPGGGPRMTSPAGGLSRGRGSFRRQDVAGPARMLQPRRGGPSPGAHGKLQCPQQRRCKREDTRGKMRCPPYEREGALFHADFWGGEGAAVSPTAPQKVDARAAVSPTSPPQAGETREGSTVLRGTHVPAPQKFPKAPCQPHEPVTPKTVNPHPEAPLPGHVSKPSLLRVPGPCQPPQRPARPQALPRSSSSPLPAFRATPSDPEPPSDPQGPCQPPAPPTPPSQVPKLLISSQNPLLAPRMPLPAMGSPSPPTP
ncbi:basic proline-rich protein-like [Cinclus cinclus]|uniref:basic proline-rich protein-like n=1 Tax=Cinclus cinclus TaxID=127875 RepID=UPI002E1448B4